MMAMGIVRGLVIFMIIPIVISTPVNFKNAQETLINIRLIEERSESRVKRSTSESNLPDQLVFEIPTHEGDARLTLSKRPLVPTYDGNGPVLDTLTDDGVYVDHSKYSAMIVKRDDNEYQLKGIFSHGGLEWELAPLQRNKRSSPYENHRVNIMLSTRDDDGKPVISFEGDQVFYHGNVKFEHVSNPALEFHTNQIPILNHVVEIAFVVDHQDYLNWENSGLYNNTDLAIQVWYTYVAEAMNIRYQTIQDPSLGITTKATHLRILKNKAESEFIDYWYSKQTKRVDQDQVLEAFVIWVNEDKSIPQSDHYMLFTGHKLSSAVGIAYVGALCSGPWSVSVITNELDGFLGMVAAHELGHSMSSAHDEDRLESGCEDEKQNIMSASYTFPFPGNERNMFEFSKCTLDSFRHFLNRVDSCTLPSNTKEPEVLPPPVEGSRAGEALTLDQQCQTYFLNDTSYFCENSQSRVFGGLWSICAKGIFCYIPDKPGYCRRVMPQEYSTCGTYQWCFQGICEDDGKERPPVLPPLPPSQGPPSSDCPSLLFRTGNKALYDRCIENYEIYWNEQQSAA